ncbi:hypothetical protein [Amycolatopsis sp. NPDC051061]|uniref:hypothetical protein n=1 Tax=Amycolatopsis sp. NPDC051061 TaxID=3155042 RepID=UPI00341E34D2
MSNAVKEGMAWSIFYALLVVIVSYFSVYALRDPKFLVGLPLGSVLNNPIFSVMNLAVAVLAVGMFLAAWRFGPRRRLLASAFFCVELLLELGPDLSEGREKVAAERFLMLRRLVVRRRRRVARVAWALTRDTSRCAGRPFTAGETLGELLLWFAENPSDRRRRPIVIDHLVELIAAVADNAPIPHAQFLPAAKYRTRSPRMVFVMQLRSFVRSAVVTGAVLAILAAILRVWID